jgi:5'(3')-deoxyribonucleotidase/uncharacterized protein with PQ loop repeat
MSVEAWVFIVGSVAAVLTTGAFVPQILRTWRLGGRDLSYGLLVLYLAGVMLWLVYGLLTGARAVVVANAAATLLVSFNLFLKWRGPAAGAGGGRARRPRISLDMDGVMADTLPKYLRTYNQAFGDHLALADLQGRALEEAVPVERAAAARALLCAPGFFRDVEVMEGCQEVVRELAERYEVLVASAAMDVPTSFDDKYAWLREHFPFIPPSHIVFCGDKSVLDVDYMIDDEPRHFARFRGTPVLFSAPPNAGESRYARVASWADVRRLLLGREPASPSAAGAPVPAQGVSSL